MRLSGPGWTDTGWVLEYDSVTWWWQTIWLNSSLKSMKWLFGDWAPITWYYRSCMPGPLNIQRDVQYHDHWKWGVWCQYVWYRSPKTRGSEAKCIVYFHQKLASKWNFFAFSRHRLVVRTPNLDEWHCAPLDFAFFWSKCMVWNTKNRPFTNHQILDRAQLLCWHNIYSFAL
jgi:hypothetical protein